MKTAHPYLSNTLHYWLKNRLYKGISLIELLTSIILFSFAISISLLALEKLNYSLRGYLTNHNQVSQLEAMTPWLKYSESSNFAENTWPELHFSSINLNYLNTENSFTTNDFSSPTWANQFSINSYSITINDDNYYFLAHSDK